MNRMDAILLRSNVKKSPKAKPLAEAFVAEAHRQGATLGDFKLGVEIATMILGNAMNPNLLYLDGFLGEIETAFESI